MPTSSTESPGSTGVMSEVAALVGSALGVLSVAAGAVGATDATAAGCVGVLAGDDEPPHAESAAATQAKGRQAWRSCASRAG